MELWWHCNTRGLPQARNFQATARGALGSSESCRFLLWQGRNRFLLQHSTCCLEAAAVAGASAETASEVLYGRSCRRRPRYVRGREAVIVPLLCQGFSENRTVTIFGWMASPAVCDVVGIARGTSQPPRCYWQQRTQRGRRWQKAEGGPYRYQL